MIKCLRVLKRQTTTQAVISALQQYIISNDLKPNDGLPSENELCRRFAVSRIVIREALQYFKSLGIIDTKPKSGAFIKTLLPENPYREYMPYMGNCETTLEELAQMRAVVDMGLLFELIDLASEKDIEALGNINAQIRTADEKERFMLDAKFHSYMIEITGNKLLKGLIPLLVDFFKKYREKRIKKNISRSSELVYAKHFKIIEALCRKDPAELYKAMKEHAYL
jgi:GntR family transcriptional repressor for pyruvate dehydrogenase complex